MKNFLFKLLDFCIPTWCTVCGHYDWMSSKMGVCKSCAPYNQSSIQSEKFCLVCKSEMQTEVCGYCDSRNIFFSELFFLRFRERKEKDLLQKVKFSEERILSNYFRLGLGKFIKIWKQYHIHTVVPLPSNRQTWRERPFHVCFPVFSYLKRRMDIPTQSLLIKTSSELQSGKSFRKRFLHARFAFSIHPEWEGRLSGNYLLVDDLFTTGASLNEAARVLLENGAEKVYGLTLLRGKSI
jgi:competence protein ComFC